MPAPRASASGGRAGPRRISRCGSSSSPTTRPAASSGASCSPGKSIGVSTLRRQGTSSHDGAGGGRLLAPPRRALLDCLVGFGAWLLGSMWLLIGVWELRGAPSDLREIFVLALAVPAFAVALHLAYHGLMLLACGPSVGKMGVGGFGVRPDGRPLAAA